MPVTPFCPEAVIFDMDGLLVDSEPVWHFVETEMLRARGKAWDYAIQKDLIGLRMTDFWERMVGAYALTEAAGDLIGEATRRMIDFAAERIVTRPGANELLAFLRARGIPCSIASSSPMALIEAVVETHDWDGYFQHYVSGDDVVEGKPAPDIYLETARRMGFQPQHILTLEDSRNGARAAVAAGMVCYAVPDPTHNSHADFDGVTPYVFDSLHEVRQSLEQHCS